VVFWGLNMENEIMNSQDKGKGEKSIWQIMKESLTSKKVDKNALARLYFEAAVSENSEIAIKIYDKAIELNPNFAEAYYNRGNAYSDLKQYERAIEDYNKAIELNPEDKGTY